MEKMRMESADLVAKNVEKIATLFPNCITEALDEEKSTGSEKVYKKVVNFDKLRQMLSGDLLDCIESYEFTWGGKRASIVEANKPIRKTLRPCTDSEVINNYRELYNKFFEVPEITNMDYIRWRYDNRLLGITG